MVLALTVVQAAASRTAQASLAKGFTVTPWAWLKMTWMPVHLRTPEKAAGAAFSFIRSDGEAAA
jgi:hypothetical protein